MLLRPFLSVLLSLCAIGLSAQTFGAPDFERGNPESISEWLAFDFNECLAEPDPGDAGDCLTSAAMKCSEAYFYRHCSNNALTLAVSWVREELEKRGAEDELIDRWFEATSTFCGLHNEFWALNDDAPPAGLRWDNSVVPCINTRVFDALEYF